MTTEQKAAFIMAQAACLNAEIAGMVAENQWRAHRGESPAYSEQGFQQVLERYSILTWNGAIAFLRE